MKHAVIGALFATGKAAQPTGCKPGINIKFFQDSDCTKDSNGTLPAFQVDVAETGKCIQHKPSDDVQALATAERDLAIAKFSTESSYDMLDNVEKLSVDDQGTKKTVPDALGDVYTDLRNLLNTSEATRNDFEAILDAQKTSSDWHLVNDYYIDFGMLYWALQDPNTSEDIAALQKFFDEAKRNLPEGVDTRVIESFVEANYNFNHALTQLKNTDGTEFNQE